MYPRNGRIAAATLCLLSLFLLHGLATGTSRNEDEIVVSEGTAVKVVTTAEITSKKAKPNDPVAFTIDEDVVINGHVVVRKGTEAIGSVVNAEKGGYMGKSGKLAIQVESTKTVDGQPLKLRAAKGKEGEDNTTSTMVLSFISPVFLFKKGGDAKVDPGTPDSRREQDARDRIARPGRKLDRQRVDFVATDRLALFGILGTQQRSIRVYCDRLVDRTDRQNYVDTGNLGNCDGDSLANEAAESGCFNHDLIVADGQRWERVIARGTRNSFIVESCRDISGGDFRALENGPTGVGNRAGDRSTVGLCEHRNVGAGSCQNRQ